MKITKTVIFVFSVSDAQYAKKYIIAHKDEKVTIIVPTISALIYLKKNNIDFQDYSKIEFLGNNYFFNILEKQYRAAHDLTAEIIKEFSRKFKNDLPVLNVLKTYLETEITEVLHADYLFNNIKKRWNPDKYLFNEKLKIKLSGWSADHFSSAALLRFYFVQENKIYHYKTHPNFLEVLNTSLFFIKLIYKKLIRIFIELLYKIELNFIFRNTIPNKYPQKTDYIFFSSAFYFNKYYPHLLNLLNKSKFTGLIISDKIGHEEIFQLHKRFSNYIPLNYFYRYLNNPLINRQSDETIIQYGWQLKKNKLQFFKNYPNLKLAIRKAITNKILLIIKNHYNNAVKQLVLSEEFFRKIEPRLLITTHDPGPSMLPFVIQAHRRKIKTLVLLHGLHNSVYGTDYESNESIVWGPELKKWYIKNFQKKSSLVHPLGFPTLDMIFQNINKKEQLPGQTDLHNINVLNIGILIAYYPPTIPVAKYFIDVFSALGNLSTPVILNVRSHPGQTLTGLNKLAKIYKIKITVNQNMAITDFTLKNDILISWDTTAILWPIIYQKPLFLAPPWWGRSHTPVDKYHAAWIPRSANDLIKQIQFLINDSERLTELQQGQKRFLKEVVGYTNGKSSEAHYKKISGLLLN